MARPRQQKYAKGSIFLDGIPLAECTKISVKHSSGANDVNTLAKGRAGESPGVQSSMVTLGSAVPVVGREYDFLDALQKGKKVEVVLFRAGKKITGEGFLREFDEDYDVNSASADNVTISCGPFEQSAI
jgi:hypothetical protein